jgi:hypothetical protein
MLAISVVSAAAHPVSTCELTGWWCCEETQVWQTGSVVTTRASYGSGNGTLTGSSLVVQFSNQPEGQAPLAGTVSPDCSSVAWSTGTAWTRAPPPWHPSTPAPAWAANLSIIELNPLTFTSPNGTGADGSGSGTWASAATRVPYLAALGVRALWLAGYSQQTAHFYGIRSVYAAVDQSVLDPGMGSAGDFAGFIDAVHSAGIRVFLDVIAHGVVDESPLIGAHPDWFAGGSWGMQDFNYSSPGFQRYWVDTWSRYATDYGVDGFRIDVADLNMMPIWDNITGGLASQGVHVAVMGEGTAYHFTQHDVTAPVANVPASLATANVGQCFQTLQFSCHDHGWESPPGNYFFLRGSRAAFGTMGALSPYIPLWLGGEEYDEDPVVDVPNLKLDLYGTSGKPGGWMYGSARQWEQAQATNHSDMLADVRALLAVQSAHPDVLHKNVCAAYIAELSVNASSAGGGLALTPYARYLPGAKAVLVLGNTDMEVVGVYVSTAVPLAAMGLAGRGDYSLQWLYGGGVPAGFTLNVTEAELDAYMLWLPPDGTRQGGLTVVLLLPAANAAH